MIVGKLTREKSSPRRRIYFGAWRDEKNRRFVSYGVKGSK